MNELSSQLHRIGGDASDPSPGQNAAGAKSATQEFPSIRQLPLLGVKWADLYRETKVQETVYELLTQQYELAKIQEAKEIPVVKVLDAANVPEKKSFPPRAITILCLACVGLLGGIGWILGLRRWHQIDPQDSRKLLVLTVWQAIATRVRSLKARMSTKKDRMTFVQQSGDRNS